VSVFAEKGYSRIFRLHGGVALLLAIKVIKLQQALSKL
jgi:hypothetical protein